LFLAEVHDPVPAEEALDGYHQVSAVGPEGGEKLVAVTGELLVNESLASLI
jgi:hypothetical protein